MLCKDEFTARLLFYDLHNRFFTKLQSEAV